MKKVGLPRKAHGRRVCGFRKSDFWIKIPVKTGKKEQKVGLPMTSKMSFEEMQYLQGFEGCQTFEVDRLF